MFLFLQLFLLFLVTVLMTSPAGAVAKYFDDHICVCVCLSVCPAGYLWNHMYDLYQFFVHVAYLRGSVLLWQVKKSQGEGAVLGVFFPIDSAFVTCSLQKGSFDCQ